MVIKYKLENVAIAMHCNLRRSPH